MDAFGLHFRPVIMFVEGRPREDQNMHRLNLIDAFYRFVHMTSTLSSLCPRTHLIVPRSRIIYNASPSHSCVRLGVYTRSRLCRTARWKSTSATTTRSPATEPTTWVDRLPTSWQPYVLLTRVDKPIGTLLLFYPCGM